MAETNVCPYLSGIIFDNTGSITCFPDVDADPKEQECRIECLGADCHLWFAPLSMCSHKAYATILYHEHQKHMHQEAHTCPEGMTTDCGSPTAETSLPQAASLSQEFMMNEDRDGIAAGALDGVKEPGGDTITGSVYGKDWQLTLDDNTPPALTGLFNHPDFNIDAPEVSWNNYLTLL